MKTLFNSVDKKCYNIHCEVVHSFFFKMYTESVHTFAEALCHSQGVWH